MHKLFQEIKEEAIIFNSFYDFSITLILNQTDIARK